LNDWIQSRTMRLARRLGWRGPFEPTHSVWSRGLALSCDHNGGVRFVREQRGGKGKPLLRPDAGAYSRVKDGDLVWVRATALPEFLDRVLPAINARFALVTGDEDWSIPGDFARAAEVCANDKVLCWFAQNFDGTDPSGKVSPLPIGIDFHTISHRRRWGHPQATPREQEIELEALRAGMPPNEQRLLRVHADFHFNKHERAVMGESRASLETILRGNPLIEFQPQKVPRMELWREKTRYAFAVSPHGNGLDCHRTWESLALGNIVIVKRSALDPLYDGLPVVIVSQWSEITAQSLSDWHRQHCHLFASPDFRVRLTNQYWIDRIRAAAKQRLAGKAGAPDQMRWDSHPRIRLMDGL
jgi:hypothetical protein